MEKEILKAVYKVRNHDIDAYGHVNNAAYLRIIEDAMVDCLEEMGIHLLEYNKRGISVIMTAVSLRYLHPSFLGDHLEVITRFRKLSKVKILWENEIHREGTGELLTRAEGKAGFVLANTRVIPIPDEAREILEKYL